MNRLCLLLLPCWLACHAPEPTPPPNIILILADDLGYGELGCYGNEDIQTPNVDRLAIEGLLFTDFHANGAVCSPTRAALLTGQYQQRNGMEGVIYVRGEARKIGLDPAVPSLADALKRQGYATGIMGKWHLGYEPQFNPVHFGFDEFWGYRSGNIDYHSHYDNAGIYDWYHKLDTVLETGYSTDLITEHARTFIQENQEQPFFLYLAHESPHVPFQARGDTAYRWPGEDFSYYGPVEDRARAYREMVEQLDEGVGDIMTQLAELGLAENTLVVFTSDNGGLRDYAHQGALRGHKTELWEGGHRVPAIAHWPGTISAGQTDQLALTFDWFPTFVQLAGGNAATLPTLDGTDLSDLLLGRQAQLAERTVFWRYRDQLAMREGQWKWLATADDTLLLDLAVDLGESQNLRLNQAARSAEMKRQAQAFSEEMDGVAQKTR